MKVLQFRYYMRLSFDGPVHDHRFTLRCVPHSDSRQSITSLQREIYPNRFISDDIDSFGNRIVYGYTKEEHDRFYFDVRGAAVTGLQGYEPVKNRYRLGSFIRQTAYTRPGPELLKYSAGVQLPDEMPVFAKSIMIMHCLHNDFEYKSGVTDIDTDAETAWSSGGGVCQDYTHIMLSLLRLRGIPCMYVTGMLLGEGLSHAWVEVSDGRQWLALDPTNNVVVDDEHIRISGGRDFSDCRINQGIFVGTACQRQEISVVVKEK